MNKRNACKWVIFIHSIYIHFFLPLSLSHKSKRMNNAEFITVGDAQSSDIKSLPAGRCSICRRMTYPVWICIFFVSLIALGLILSSVSLGKVDAFIEMVSSKVLQMQYDGTMIQGFISSETGSLLSLAFLFKTNKPVVIMFCSVSQLYTLTNLETEPLKIANGKSINELTSVDLKDAYFSSISTRVKIIYNVDVKNNEGVPISTKRKKYMSIQYNITSRLTYFSTIKLVELEFDTPDQSIRVPRSIPLCSNNPAILETKRCDQLVSRQNIMLLHGEVRVSLFSSYLSERDGLQGPPLGIPHASKMPSQPPPPQLKPKSPPPTDGDEIVYGPDTDGDGQSWNEKQTDDIMGERVYNIIFFRQEKSTDSKAPISPTDGTARPRETRPLYQEREVLSIEPSKCK